MPTVIYITRLKGDSKLLAASWDLEEAAKVATTLIKSSQGEASEDDFEYIPMYLPERKQEQGGCYGS